MKTSSRVAAEFSSLLFCESFQAHLCVHSRPFSLQDAAVQLSVFSLTFNDIDAHFLEHLQALNNPPFLI